MKRKKPGGEPNKYLVEWSRVDVKPIEPKPVRPSKQKERVTLKVTEAWFATPLVGIKANPSYIGSGQGWEHVLLLAKDDYLQIEYTDLASPTRAVKVVCVPYANVKAFVLAS